jgi:hypothetical protein
MKENILFAAMVALIILACFSKSNYKAFEEDYKDLQAEYDSLQSDYEDLQGEMEDYIHRDEVHSNYISEEDFSHFLEAVYDEDGDYIHKDRIEDLVNYYCY